MPYELTLHPNCSSPVTEEEIREKLLSIGPVPDPGSAPAGMLFDGFGHLQIEEDPESASGLRVTAKLPYGRPVKDVCLELVFLTHLASLLNAELRDGDKVVQIPLTEENLTPTLMAFCKRYIRASEAAARVLGRIG